MKFTNTARRRTGILLLTLLAVAGGGLPWAGADAPPPQAPDEGQTVRRGEAPPRGKECVVVIEHGEGEMEVAGRLQKATEQWIVVQAEREGRAEGGHPILSKVPYTGRLFRNVGIGRSSEDIWIPRQRVLYLRVAGPLSALTPAVDNGAPSLVE